MSTYYDRRPTTIDGQSAFANAHDKANEEDVRAAIESAWGVEIRRYGGHFDAIDFYALRGQKIAAHLELKSRTHESTKYPTVFLNVRKWMALTMTWLNMGVPSLFIVRFTNEIRWIDVKNVDARNIRLGGCSRVVKAKSDIEPVIEVPIGQMNTLRKRGNA